MSSTLRRLVAFASFSYLFTLALSAPRSLDHAHEPSMQQFGAAWYQPDDHPAHALFRRDSQTDGTAYAVVGSPAWSAGFPQGKPNPNALPQAWVDALNAAVAAGNIPNIPPSTLVGGNPTYPSGNDPNGATVCSTTYQCMKNNDTWNAPDGVFGASFDDGPLPTSDKLYQFLQTNNVHATHFFIGTNILNNPKEFTMAFDTLQDDIAVHTWTHPYMTTLSNKDVVGELGWTMQIIHNSTGGRVPRYWRPPYGDSDNRVSAIAKEVFGLQTVIWNQDTADWSITSGGTTVAKVDASLTKWLTGPKSPGLIVLEHELSDQSVQAFINAFPLIKSNGWNFVSVAQLDGGSPYWNSPSSAGSVSPAGILIANSTSPSSSASSSGPSSSVGSSSSGSASASHTSSGSSQSSSPTGTTRQQSGASSSMIELAYSQLRGVLATCVTVLLSTVALF